MYRLVEFPTGEHEDLVIAWLWSDRAGVFSHDTALALHNLSDALPAHLHMTLPATWIAGPSAPKAMIVFSRRVQDSPHISVPQRAAFL